MEEIKEESLPESTGPLSAEDFANAGLAPVQPDPAPVVAPVEDDEDDEEDEDEE